MPFRLGPAFPFLPACFGGGGNPGGVVSGEIFNNKSAMLSVQIANLPTTTCTLIELKQNVVETSIDSWAAWKCPLVR